MLYKLPSVWWYFYNLVYVQEIIEYRRTKIMCTTITFRSFDNRTNNGDQAYRGA